MHPTAILLMNLVLCLDGTASTFGKQPSSNALRIFQMLDNENQICYYQPGVGTSLQVFPARAGCLVRERVEDAVDSAFAFSLDTHVQAAYLFLVRFYEPEARIFLFGFSRGSFTARVLAGMIEHVGLLHRGLEGMVSTAWELYSGWEIAGQPIRQDRHLLLELFKRTFCRNVRIEFMGLWDTVNLVGVLRDRLFPYSVRSSIVNHVRHALSVDERRGRFKQVLFVPVAGFWPCESHQSLYARIFKQKIERWCSDDIVELWFPGNHGDVGGGWPANSQGHVLLGLSLRWILLEAIAGGVGIEKNVVSDFNASSPVVGSFFLFHHDVLSWKREKTAEVAAAVKEFNSRGNESWFYTLLWWLVELLPLGSKTENKEGVWKRRWLPNLGQYRTIPDAACFHWSVFFRLHFVEDYRPKNLPFHLGKHFLALLERVTQVPDHTRRYVLSLTLESIREQSEHAVWQAFPDDLATGGPMQLLII